MDWFVSTTKIVQMRQPITSQVHLEIYPTVGT